MRTEGVALALMVEVFFSLEAKFECSRKKSNPDADIFPTMPTRILFVFLFLSFLSLLNLAVTFCQI